MVSLLKLGFLVAAAFIALFLPSALAEGLYKGLLSGEWN